MKKKILKKQWNKPKMETLTHNELAKTIIAGACSGYGGCGGRSRIAM